MEEQCIPQALPNTISMVCKKINAISIFKKNCNEIETFHAAYLRLVLNEWQQCAKNSTYIWDDPCVGETGVVEYFNMIDTKKYGTTRVFAVDCKSQRCPVVYITNDKLAFDTLSLHEMRLSRRSGNDIFVCSKCKGIGGMKAPTYTHDGNWVWVREYLTDYNACKGKGIVKTAAAAHYNNAFSFPTIFVEGASVAASSLVLHHYTTCNPKGHALQILPKSA